MLKGSKFLIVNDEQLSRLAGLEKCRQRLDLSLSDWFAVALAKREKAILLTSDGKLKKAKGVQVFPV
jgi:predicted nucleic acid-binding protein